MHLLRQLWIKFSIVGLTLGFVIGILIPIFIGGDSSVISVGDRIILAGNPQTDKLSIPLSTANATASGWIDPILCAAGRGRYFTKPDSTNLIILYNNQENVMGLYISSDVEMPEPWKKIDALKGGGGLELIDKEHWGLYAFFNDSLKACERPDASTSHTQSFLGPHAVRTEYEPTPTPDTKLGVSESLEKSLTSISSDSRTFAITNASKQTIISTDIKSSQIHEFLSGINNVQEGNSKWIDNVSHRGLTGDMNASYLLNILDSSAGDSLKVSLWINDGNQINFIEITGTITHDGSQFSKLNISPE